MSEGVGLLFAITISIGLFSLLFYIFRHDHPLLRLVFIMGIVVSGFFIPTSVYQLRNNCDTVVANSTATSNVTTSYSYTNFCYTTTSTAPDTFYNVMWSLYQIIIIYIIIHVIILLVVPVWERLKRW